MKLPLSSVDWRQRKCVPHAVVWRGDHSLPPHKQGSKVLRVPFGPEFVKKFFQKRNSKVLLDRIPAIQNTKLAWLLLSFCAAARSNFFLGAVNPQFTQEFHDEGVWQCLCRMLSVHADCGAQEQSSPPLWEGGIGLRSARRIRGTREEDPSQPRVECVEW